MKKILTLALGVVAMLTSCQKAEIELSPETNEVTFNLAVDNSVDTRSGDDATITRYIMEVYAPSAVSSFISRVEQSSSTFIVSLTEGTEYLFYFYADYGTVAEDTEEGNEYDASALSYLLVQSQPTMPCFVAVENIKPYSSTAEDKSFLTPTLTHAVSQVNFVQGDEDFAEGGNTLTVTIPKTYSYNVNGGAITEIADTETTFTFENIAAASKGETIGTSYIFAKKSDATVMDITVQFNNEEAKTVSNVPFQKNYKTNISGLFNGTYSSELTVTSEDTYGDDNNATL